ncbi:MAG: glutamine--fructose-6-phosphate transaminase (isomerizing) [Ignisphaera sp.]
MRVNPMGGVFAVLSLKKLNVVDIVVKGLKLLEFRGFNGSGVAVLNNDNVAVYKDAQKIDNVYEKYKLDKVSSWIALGHTRYATHGKPHIDNTHPHVDCSNRIAVAGDGAIANYESLKDETIMRGHRVVSRSDFEVIAHIIEDQVGKGLDLLSSFREVLKDLDGFYNIVALDSKCKCLAAYVHGPPLYVGVSSEYIAISSGKGALYGVSDRYFRLEDGEILAVSENGLVVENLKGDRVAKELKPIDIDPRYIDKDGYQHNMLREIYEIPEALLRTLYSVQEKYLSFAAKLVNDAEKIFIIGNGTSLHAAYIGSYYLSELAGITSIVVSAAEFPLYHVDNVGPGTVVIAISQSGETGDVLSSVFEAKLRGATILGLTNYIGSRLANLSNLYLPIGAGPEVAIPATKTFTSTLLLLYLIALRAGRNNGKISSDEYKARIEEIKRLSKDLKNNIPLIEGVAEVAAKKIAECRSGYIISRGITYPLALEAALKIKEVAYMHAEGVEAGEFKHGPQTIIEKGIFTTFIMPVEKQALQATYELIAMAQEKGSSTIIVGFESDIKINEVSNAIRILIPYTSRYLAPIALIIPLQLTAYKLGLILNRPIDNPRYLTKTVH